MDEYSNHLIFAIYIFRTSQMNFFLRVSFINKKFNEKFHTANQPILQYLHLVIMNFGTRCHVR